MRSTRSNHRQNTCLRRLAVAITGLLACTPTGADNPSFVEVSTAIGVQHDHRGEGPGEHYHIAGGVAAGDVDGNGFADLVFVGGYNPPVRGGELTLNQLFLNDGGQFTAAPLPEFMRRPECTNSGPLLADFDADGDLDLLLPGLEAGCTILARNDSDGQWTDISFNAGLDQGYRSMGAAAGDADGDGILDLYLARWNSTPRPQYYRGLGDGRFFDATSTINTPGVEILFTFTPNFEDFDEDGDIDLLVAGDFGPDNCNPSSAGSRVFRNDGGVFNEATDNCVITDENGMGAAVADYDNDGDFDWFVTSIYDDQGGSEGNWGVSGNRLYRNDGGVFSDVTDAADVRDGDWGWGACLADFDNDSWLDIFHTNGFFLDHANPTHGTCLPGAAAEFCNDQSRLFMGNSNGRFEEVALAAGIDDQGQGRGVSCLDLDHDGDQDIVVANNTGPARVYRNQTDNGHHFLTVLARNPDGNPTGIGVKIVVTANGTTQTRRIRAGSNYASQNPPEAHFGLGADATVAALTVEWTSGEIETFTNVAANQRLLIIRDQIFSGTFD